MSEATVYGGLAHRWPARSPTAGWGIHPRAPISGGVPDRRHGHHLVHTPELPVARTHGTDTFRT